ncbi:hypothetical protein [Pontibacter burrus]|nr:hypothetical protein [Pontibacter burrus]
MGRSRPKALAFYGTAAARLPVTNSIYAFGSFTGTFLFMSL